MSDSPTAENVISVAFSEDSNAFMALTELKQLNLQGQLGLHEAAVVVRDEDGKITIRDQVGDDGLVGTASGGFLGLVIGIIGGPLGILIGGAAGMLAGSLFDMHDADETHSVLGEISASVRVGHPALLAQVTEPSREVVDVAMGVLGGEVLRRPVSDVKAEIAGAEKAHRKARHEARKELREARRKKHAADVDEKIAELKAKLHHDKQPIAAG